MEPETLKHASYKRLIVCVDGTWLGSNLGGISWLEAIVGHGTWLTNILDDVNRPSNVALMSRAIAKTGINEDGLLVKQVVYYHAGLGSGSLPFQKSIYGSLGWGLEQDVAQIYDFIANNYEKDDEIFLFGFSRGAFTVRSIAGLLCDVGVLKSVRMSRFPELWRAYQRNTHGDKFRHSAWYVEHHKELELTDVRIKVVGVWDTVGALGLPEDWNSVRFLKWLGVPINKHHSFHRTSLSKRIENAYQALALDEKRTTFPPILWHKTATSPIHDLKQCWFPGVHGNIGGQAETWPEVGDHGQIGYMSFAWMVDNLSGKLTFDRSAIRAVIDMHRVALYKIGREHSLYSSNAWSCGKIVSNFWGLPGPFFWLLGSKTRTPATYPKAAKDGVDDATNESIHPSARIRRGRISSWAPPSLAGWTLQEHIEGKGWYWTKYGVERVREDVMNPNKQRMCWSYCASEPEHVEDEEDEDEESKTQTDDTKDDKVKDDKDKVTLKIYREKDGKAEVTGGPLRFNKNVGSLSRKLCPDNILRQLDTGNGLTIEETGTMTNGTNGINGTGKNNSKSKKHKSGSNGDATNGANGEINGH